MLTGTGPTPLKMASGPFKRVSKTGPRLANATEKGRLSLTDFFPEVEK
jgi:hypothetical protein